MSILNFPDQTIPETQKDENWHISHVVNYVQNTNGATYDYQRSDILKYYRAYNAELDEKGKQATKVITCPNGYDLGVEYIVYPLIQSKIEQLIGEYMQRPLMKKAYVVDKKSKNKKYQQRLEMLSEAMMRDLIDNKIKPNLDFDPETANPQMELPKDAKEFDNMDFKMMVEDLADKILMIFLDVRKEKHKLKDCFRDYAISDRGHFILSKAYGYTTARKVHPLDCDYDIDPYKVVQDDHDMFFESWWLTENDVYNYFSLDNNQKECVKNMFQSMSNTKNVESDSDDLSTSLKYDGWYLTNNKIGRIRVVNAMWKSRKRVSIKSEQSKKDANRIFYKKTDENGEENKNIDHIDGEMPRHCMMIGPELCLSYGLMKERLSYIDSPWYCTLPVVSIIRDNNTGTSLIKSIAAKLYQLQELASEILFEIRLAIKHLGDSRVLLYDAAQTPKAFSKAGFESGLNKVAHHLKKDKIVYINSKEKGAGKNSFNQFTSLDLSSKGAIQDMFNGLAVIEDLASKFVGMAPEREGQVGQYQTATGTDKAIRGSFARTEVIFSPFDEFVQVLLEKVLLRAKHDYEENQILQYIVGDGKTKFLKMLKGLFLSDFGVYLGDPGKDKKISEMIDNATQLALSNSNTPEMVMGLIEVFEGDNASEKKAVFQRLLDSMEKIRQENIKIQQAQIENENAQKEAQRQEDSQLKREGFGKDIKVAEIYSDSKAYDANAKTTSQERIASAKIAAEQNRNLDKKNK